MAFLKTAYWHSFFWWIDKVTILGIVYIKKLVISGFSRCVCKKSLDNETLLLTQIYIDINKVKINIKVQINNLIWLIS